MRSITRPLIFMTPAGADLSGLRLWNKGWVIIFAGMTHPRYFVPGELQFITASTYRRVSLFTSPRFCREFVKVLDAIRAEFKFLLLGWVLMPEHFHILIWPQPAESTSRVVHQLKQRTAASILRTLRANQDKPWCERMLAKLRLPPSVHDQTLFRVWQRRFYPFGIYSEKKLREKLDYMHANPVKRRLVDSAEKWPWSSFRFYHLGDSSVLEMDRMP